jgi:hypothetical protein
VKVVVTLPSRRLSRGASRPQNNDGDAGGETFLLPRLVRQWGSTPRKQATTEFAEIAGSELTLSFILGVLRVLCGDFSSKLEVHGTV